MNKLIISNKAFWLKAGLLSSTLLIASCAYIVGNYLDELYGVEMTQSRLVPAESAAGIFYHSEVKPIIEQRCVVCHGCNDAPCQLKLSSPIAIDRGATKAPVYNGGRLRATKPTRLFEDASSTLQWREKNFHPVLNERDQQPATNLDASMMYQLLKLKQQYPLDKKPLLDDSFDLGLAQNHQCPTIDEWQDYEKNQPQLGMPYGLPGLSDMEFNTFEKWLRSGAIMADKSELNEIHKVEVNKWEAFLNGDSLKQQLMSRYVYEHWFLANLYFNQLDKGEYFKLVRSSTPPGEPIARISTRRPYGNPGYERIYYRLWREQGTILAKTHMPYALNDERLDWMQTLFLDADYEVSALPSYETEVAANPFISFQAIPVNSRWRFILEESRFTIMNFIKGPVCRGQIALNVINDHFWVVFVDPEVVNKPEIEQFLAEQKHHLRMPSEEESNARPLKTWIKYSRSQENYLKAKTEWLTQQFDSELLNLDLIWAGEKHNKNAALTVFRHFDSASVVHGLVGQPPKTAWLINYALLERIHYLLVAGFDVYGNVGHQLTTRLYMDFLRMEGEFNFLALLPAETRKMIRDQWYRDASEHTKSYIFGKRSEFDKATGISYQTNDPKSELYGMIKTHLAPVLNREYDIGKSTLSKKSLSQLDRLDKHKGRSVSFLPQTAILSVNADNESSYFTVIHNNAHSNIASLLREDSTRLPDEDNITVVNGFIGDYPGAFWQVDENKLEQLVDDILSMQSGADYGSFMNRYGIRRTDNRFWAKSDELHHASSVLHNQDSGLLDYSRLENR